MQFSGIFYLYCFKHYFSISQYDPSLTYFIIPYLQEDLHSYHIYYQLIYSFLI